MHEIAVTQALMNMILEEAKGNRVTAVYVQVGEVSCIVPHQIEIFFKYLSRKSAAENAQLYFEITPLEISCPKCKRIYDLDQFKEKEPRYVMFEALARGCECGNRKMSITGGTGFQLKGIKIQYS